MTRPEAYVDGRNFWPDNGCEVAPKCLECPLPVCRYEEPGGLRAILNFDRDDRIREKHGTMSAASLAQEEGVSKRTLYRVLAK